MEEKIIKHKDPFLGEIELLKVGDVVVSAYHDKHVYYINNTEKWKGKDKGLYYKDIKGKIHYIQDREVEMISRIYEKLHRID